MKRLEVGLVQPLFCSYFISRRFFPLAGRNCIEVISSIFLAFMSNVEDEIKIP